MTVEPGMWTSQIGFRFSIFCFPSIKNHIVQDRAKHIELLITCIFFIILYSSCETRSSYDTFVELFQLRYVTQPLQNPPLSCRTRKREFLQAWKKYNKEDHLLLAVLGIGHITPLLVFLLSVLQMKAWSALLISFPWGKRSKVLLRTEKQAVVSALLKRRDCPAVNQSSCLLFLNCELYNLFRPILYHSFIGNLNVSFDFKQKEAKPLIYFFFNLFFLFLFLSSLYLTRHYYRHALYIWRPIHGSEPSLLL